MTKVNKPVVVKVKNLSKSFKLPHEQHNGVKQLLINFFKRKKGYETQQVLDDISFDIHQGEFFGIVGRNGSGKSTLLKLLAGIYTPDAGEAHIDGTVTPFIELGVGFNPELTGRENVYLNSALLGLSREEVDVIYDEVVHFAELDRFMDQKLKNYSSGMQVRLAFSIAIRAKSDVLIMDEVLAVGDAAFQKKCFDVFRKLKADGQTIILVTHDMGNVERFCDRVLIIDKGYTLALTDAAGATSIYNQLNVENEESVDIKKNKKVRLGSGEVTLRDYKLLHKGDETKDFAFGSEMTLRLLLERKQEYMQTPVSIGLAIFNEDDIVVLGPNTRNAMLSPGVTDVELTIPRLPFKNGQYKITLVIYDKDEIDRLDYLEKWITFEIISDHAISGLVEIDTSWKELK